ncbi:MAG: hypothetical protein RL226_2298, partial [Bacteroidota bacterium]
GMLKGLSIVFIGLLALISACNNQPAGDVVSVEHLVRPEYATHFHFTSIDGVDCIRLQTDSVNSCLICKEEIEGAVHLTSPQFATLSTTHLSYLNKLGALSMVKASAYADYVLNAEVKGHIAAGHIQSLGDVGVPDLERTVAAGANVLLVYPYGNEDFSKLEQAGIHVIPITEYLEQHPLGRAEWIKVFGFLTNREDEANQLFNAIRDEYRGVMAKVANKATPTVFTGSAEQGKWYAPSGDSFISVLIRDAGARYIFDETRGGENLTMDMEELLAATQNAELFGKVFYASDEVTLNDFTSGDQRVETLPAVVNKRLFYCNSGTTDYFGDGVIEPHKILMDLAAIFHPELFPSHQPTYFQVFQ